MNVISGFSVSPSELLLDQQILELMDIFILPLNLSFLVLIYLSLILYARKIS